MRFMLIVRMATEQGNAAVREGRIIVRRAIAGERLETLDHVIRELDPETLVIADGDGAVGIAGIMGGAASEVSSTTTDVIVESAIFDPVSIRRSAFRYALRSDASLRFEKGQEWRLARIGADRTSRLLTEWSGGTAWRGVVDSAGHLIAHPDISLVLQKRDLARLPQVQAARVLGAHRDPGATVTTAGSSS